MATKKTTSIKFEDMTKPELIKLCEDFGLKASSRAKKDELIKMLKSSQSLKKASEKAPKKKDMPKAKSKKAEPKKEAEAKEPKLTGKEIGRKRQLKIREEKLESAEKIYDDDIENTMHSMDRIKPKVRKNRPKVHTVRPEDAFKKREPDPEEVELIQSMNDPFFTLTGVVEGTGNTERLRLGNGVEVEFVYIVVDYKGKTIRIPSYHFFPDFADKKKYPSGTLHSMLQHRIGSEIDFNLIHQDQESTSDVTRFYGTRLLASKIKRCDDWYSKMDDGTWYIREGDEIEARVVEVWPKTVIVEVSGAETSVPLWEVTRRYISNVETQTDIKTGDIVKVKVSNIRREEVPKNVEGFSFPVKFDASIKACEPDPQKIFYNDFDIGDTRRAIVTNIKEEDGVNQFYCQLVNKPVVVKCYMVEGSGRNGHLPKLDQEVRIRIRKKDEKRFFLYGEIIRVIDERAKSETAFTIKA